MTCIYFILKNFLYIRTLKKCFLNVFILKYFMDLEKVVKIEKFCVPFTQFLPLVTSYVTIIQAENWETDIATMYPCMLQFPVTYHMCRFMCPPHTQNVTKIALVLLLLYCHIHFPSHPPPFLAPGNHESLLHLHNFVTLRMLHKGKYIVCDLWRLTFFTFCNALEMHPNCYVSTISF